MRISPLTGWFDFTLFEQFHFGNCSWLLQWTRVDADQWSLGFSPKDKPVVAIYSYHINSVNIVFQLRLIIEVLMTDRWNQGSIELIELLLDCYWMLTVIGCCKRYTNLTRLWKQLDAHGMLTVNLVRGTWQQPPRVATASEVSMPLHIFIFSVLVY